MDIYEIPGVGLGSSDTSAKDVVIYIFDQGDRNEVSLRADRLYGTRQITICIWVYIDANVSQANVVSFGEKLRFNIYYGNQYKFIVNFYDWNRYVSLNCLSACFKSFYSSCSSGAAIMAI